ncbi:MAG TPA: hypothetical protein DCX19_06515 [Alphaproteobacteria bacterium]|nr:hypothetical protein [Alphaproteobacteria bacterium]
MRENADNIPESAGFFEKLKDMLKKDCGNELPISYSAFHELVDEIMQEAVDECPECHHAME